MVPIQSRTNVLKVILGDDRDGSALTALAKVLCLVSSTQMSTYNCC